MGGSTSSDGSIRNLLGAWKEARLRGGRRSCGGRRSYRVSWAAQLWRVASEGQHGEFIVFAELLRRECTGLDALLRHAGGLAAAASSRLARSAEARADLRRGRGQTRALGQGPCGPSSCPLTWFARSFLSIAHPTPRASSPSHFHPSQPTRGSPPFDEMPHRTSPADPRPGVLPKARYAKLQILACYALLNRIG